MKENVRLLLDTCSDHNMDKGTFRWPIYPGYQKNLFAMFWLPRWLMSTDLRKPKKMLRSSDMKEWLWDKPYARLRVPLGHPCTPSILNIAERQKTGRFISASPLTERHTRVPLWVLYCWNRRIHKRHDILNKVYIMRSLSFVVISRPSACYVARGDLQMLLVPLCSLVRHFALLHSFQTYIISHGSQIKNAVVGYKIWSMFS